MSGVEYNYGGQWFDDMGALAAAFVDTPVLGVDISRANLKRSESNDLASSLLNVGISPYDTEESPEPGV